MEKETLEEASYNYAKDKMNRTSHLIGFREGAKWMEEKMYSEEDIRASLADFLLINPAHLQMTSNGYGEFPDGYKLTEKGISYIIEQFKK